MYTYKSTKHEDVETHLLPSVPASFTLHSSGGQIVYKPQRSHAPDTPYYVSVSKSRPKKRRRLNDGESVKRSVADVQNKRLHDDVVEWIREGMEGLLSEMKQSISDVVAAGKGDVSIWERWVEEEGFEDENTTREMGWEWVDGEKLRRDMGDRVWVLERDERVDPRELYHRPILNTSRNAIRLHLSLSDTHLNELKEDQTIMVPPYTGFLLGDMSVWEDGSSLSSIASPSISTERASTSTHIGWDLIILDPPWPNASVSRGRRQGKNGYKTFDAYDLLLLNLPLKPSTRTMVVVWVTNRVKFRELLKTKVFDQWGVKLVAEWYWVKVAKSGEPVYGWDESKVNGRRSYEGLIIGEYDKRADLQKQKSDVPIPSRKVLVSIPTQHSRKPPILEVLKPYLDRADQMIGWNVLEYFGRGVMSPISDEQSQSNEAGNGEKHGLWMTVGNESVKWMQARYLTTGDTK